MHRIRIKQNPINPFLYKSAPILSKKYGFLIFFIDLEKEQATIYNYRNMLVKRLLIKQEDSLEMTSNKVYCFIKDRYGIEIKYRRRIEKDDPI